MTTPSREALLAECRVAEQRLEFREEGLLIAKVEARKADRALREARYRLVVSVPCSYCGAGVGENCFLFGRSGKRVGEYYTLQHGVRQDLSGASGDYSRDRQVRKNDRHVRSAEGKSD